MIARVPRKIWLLFIVVGFGLILLAAQNSTVLFPEMASYHLVDQQTLSLKVAAAPCSWTRVTGVTETATDIRIKVETLPCPINFLPHTDELDFQEVTVSLAHDVANRTIADAQG